MAYKQTNFPIDQKPTAEEIVAEVMSQLRNSKPERYSAVLRSLVPRVVRRLENEREVARSVAAWLKHVLQVTDCLTLETWRVRVVSSVDTGVHVDLGYFNRGENSSLEFNVSRLKKGGYHIQFDSKRKIKDLPRVWKEVLAQMEQSEDGWIEVDSEPPRRKRRKRDLPRYWRLE